MHRVGGEAPRRRWLAVARATDPTAGALSKLQGQQIQKEEKKVAKGRCEWRGDRMGGRGDPNIWLFVQWL